MFNVERVPANPTRWYCYRCTPFVFRFQTRDISPPLNAFDLLCAGVRQVATDLLGPWASPMAPGLSQPMLLPQSLELDQGYEGGGEKMGGLFEGGLWATSVRRKRVTKMRKHKWRKRRKLARQSASRRVNK